MELEYTLITGASGGIGEALAQHFAAEARNLVLVARSTDKLQILQSTLQSQYGVKVEIIACDLSVPDAPRLLFEETSNRNLTIEILINNAGIGCSGEFTDTDLPSLTSLLQLNITALVQLSHLYLTCMKKQKRGTLVNIASMTAFMPVPYMATYAASKCFVRSFTEALTHEYQPYGISILLVSPGLTRTNFNAAAGLNNQKGIALQSDYANGAPQTPAEVAAEVNTALRQKKHSHISGTKNRWGMRLLALIPNNVIANYMARSYRKKMAGKT